MRKKSRRNRPSGKKKPNRRTRSSSRTAFVGTFESWVENQQKLRKHPIREQVGRPKSVMPVGSMEGWLRNQPVIEKEITAEIRLPLGSTEEWLHSQVSDRLSKEEKVKIVEELATGEALPTTDVVS